MNLQKAQSLDREQKNFIFTFDLALNGSYYVDVANKKQVDSVEQQTQYYAPLKNIQVINQSTRNIGIKINGSKSYKLIPAGTIYEEKNLTVWSFEVVNLGSDVANNITVTADNSVSDSELLDLIARRGARL